MHLIELLHLIEGIGRLLASNFMVNSLCQLKLDLFFSFLVVTPMLGKDIFFLMHWMKRNHIHCAYTSYICGTVEMNWNSCYGLLSGTRRAVGRSKGCSKGGIRWHGCWLMNSFPFLTFEFCVSLLSDDSRNVIDADLFVYHLPLLTVFLRNFTFSVLPADYILIVS